MQYSKFIGKIGQSLPISWLSYQPSRFHHFEYTPSAVASLNEASPELQQLALNFLATFFSRHFTEVIYLHAPGKFFPCLP